MSSDSVIGVRGAFQFPVNGAKPTIAETTLAHRARPLTAPACGIAGFLDPRTPPLRHP